MEQTYEKLDFLVKTKFNTSRKKLCWCKFGFKLLNIELSSRSEFDFTGNLTVALTNNHIS